MSVRRPILLAFALLTASCGGDPTAPPDKGVLRFSLVAADAPLTGTVGAMLPVQLEVQAKMSLSGEPVPGQVVSFVVVEPNCGRAFAGTATTNAAGSAREQWELGTKAGTCTMEVRAVDQETGEPLVLGSFTVEVQPGPATFVGLYSISEVFPATVFTDDVLPLAWFVRLAHDAHRNPITDFAVTGRVLTGPATIVDGALVGGSSEAVGTVEVTALGVTETIAYSVARDLRRTPWRFEATCANGQTIGGVRYRASDYRLAVDSVTYDRSHMTGTVATLHMAGTVTAQAVESQGGQTISVPATWRGTVESLGHPGALRLVVRQTAPTGLNLGFALQQTAENPDHYYDPAGAGCQGSASLVATSNP